MRVLITGANGMLGAELQPLLAAAQHEVRACSHAECDITDGAAVRRVFSDAKPQVVINCAAMTDVDGCERDPQRAMLVNARGAGNVARAAEAIGARVFHISTDYVFSGSQRRAFTEPDKPNPISIYGQSKLEGERMVLYAAGRVSPHLVIRTSWLYGRARVNFVDRVVEQARAGQPIKAVTDQVSCLTWTRPLAERIAQLVDKTASGILHLAGSGECTRYEIAQYIVSKLDAASLPKPAELVPSSWAKLNLPARRPAYSAITSSRLAALELAPLPDWRASLDEYLKCSDP
jgi:dTDP-4-dehydrorhamnose reductase